MRSADARIGWRQIGAPAAVGDSERNPPSPGGLYHGSAPTPHNFVSSPSPNQFQGIIKAAALTVGQPLT